MLAILRTENNITDGEEKDLTLLVEADGSTATATKRIVPVSTNKDDEPPIVVEGPTQPEGKNGIKIVFSEPVEGADKKDAYVIKDKSGKQISIEAIDYNKGSKTESPYAEITFASDPYTDEYTLTFTGADISDISKEKNPLVGSYEFSYEGRSTFQKVIDTVLDLLRAWWWVVLLIGIIIVVLIVIGYFKKRRGLIKIEGRIGFGDAVEFKQRFSTPSTGAVTFIVTDTTGASRRVDADINKSFFVGRSGINNLSFNDDKMSRQHFVVETEGGAWYITDLGTTNGTYLNGVPVKNRREIKNNDVITAGREKLVFRVNADVGRDETCGGETAHGA
jgi:hypothetical protein